MHAASATEHDTIAGIISEFSEAFAFSRTRWTRFANEVNPDLSGVSMLVLQIVYRKGPIAATGIGQLLDMDKSLVSRQVARLRKLGFIETAEASEDRRVQLLTVTARATQLLDSVRERWAAGYRERLREWSDSELETLRAGLHRFNASAEDPAEQDNPAARCARRADEDHG